MQITAQQFDLKLYHQDRFYSFRDLMVPAEFYAEQESVTSVPAVQVFQTTLALVSAFINQQTVFPVADDFSTAKITELVTQLKAKNRQLDSMSKIALAISTSGSHAKPKIALISYQNIVSHCQNFYQRVPMPPSSLWLNCMPLQHIAGLMIIYRCALSSSTMLLHDHFNATKIWADLHQYPVSHISLVPAMLAQLLKIQSEADNASIPDSLKYVIVGGDALTAELHQAALDKGWPVLISYGMTEATSTIALGDNAAQLRPLDGFELYTDTNNVLSVRGDMVISSYAVGPKDCFDKGWFRTSDRVIIRQGMLEVLGRNDYMIISGGENLSPEYIESLLIKAPMIKDIAVGSVIDEVWGHSIAALVDGELEDFKDWLKKQIKSVYRPRIFIPLTGIPRNALGKIDRRRVQTIINNKQLDNGQ